MVKTKNRQSVKKLTKIKRNPFEDYIKNENITTLQKQTKNCGILVGQWRVKVKDNRLSEKLSSTKSNVNTNKVGLDLNDDEIFTHNNQNLSEIEKFENSDIGDEINYQNQGLDSSFISKAHFSDGLLTDTGHEGVTIHKEFINELINESKKRKAEQQKLKEQTFELTEKLDYEWKDLVHTIGKSNIVSKVDNKKKEETKFDTYDKCINELRFEARGTVSDRLKTVDEVATEETAKLEKLGREKNYRMQNPADKVKTIPHRSADDLDDFHIGSNSAEVLKSELKVEDEGNINQELDEQYDLEDTLAVFETNEITSGDYADKNKRKRMQIEENEKLKKKRKENSIKTQQNDAQHNSGFTVTIPETYEKFKSTIETLSPSDQNNQKLILERMIKYNPGLSQESKSKLNTLFVFTLQYLNDLFSGKNDPDTLMNNFNIWQSIMPAIYDLSQLDPENTFITVSEVIKEKYEKYKRKMKKCPGIEVLVFLKLVGLLFSTSDFRHQIVTPCFIFMEQILNKCRIKTIENLSYGLYITTLVIEYTAVSKRYLPAGINFLNRIITLATSKRNNVEKSISSINLAINDDCTNLIFNIKLNASYLIGKQISDIVKISILHTTLKLLKDMMKIYKELPSFDEIFVATRKLLKSIEFTLYPKEVQSLYHEICNLNSHVPKTYLSLDEQHQKKSLRVYEPKAIEIYYNGSKSKTVTRNLIHKVKKETKNTLKHIRRNKIFLSHTKIKEKILNDREIKTKVNQIFNETSIQQKELNALGRRNHRK